MNSSSPTSTTHAATDRLHGRTAVDTGSTSGIGAAIAAALAVEGAHVLVSGRDRTRGTAIVTAIQANGGPARSTAMKSA